MTAIRSFLAVVGIGMACLSSGACATGKLIPSGHVSASAVQYNFAIERAQNEILLLNIVRSSQDMPLYLTAIANIVGGLSIQIDSGGLVIGAQSGVKPKFDWTLPSFTVTSTPTFDMGVLDTKEFLRGFTTPVTPQVINGLLEQNWDPSLLLFLLADKICDASNDCLENDLQKLGRSGAPVFNDFKALYEPCSLGATTVDDINVLQPAVKMTSTTPIPPDGHLLAALLTAYRDGLTPVLDNNELKLTTSLYQLLLDCPSGKAVGKRSLNVAQQRAPAQPPAGKPEKPEVPFVVTLRSPAAVLVYLGQIARQTATATPNSPATLDVKGKWLFNVAGNRCPTGRVAIEYDAQPFRIPNGTSDCQAGWSYNALGLLTQLISLQKSAEALPSTGVVRVVGR